MPQDFWDYLDKLVDSHPLVIERPVGSRHPRYPEVVYPLDYGYLEGTTSIDKGGIDVWLGTKDRESCKRAKINSVQAVICSVDLKKNDVEIKIVLNCRESEIQTILAFQNDKMMRAILIRRPNIIKETT
jgi:inorganic pyrophosphatase